MATRTPKKNASAEPANDRVRVSCSLAPDTVRLIDVLAETGLFGRSRAEVLERLATDRITKMWQDGDLHPDRLGSLLIKPTDIRAMKQGDARAPKDPKEDR